MQIEPAADAFAEIYARGAPQVVWTTLVADLETPVSAYLKVAGARPGAAAPMSFLLESVEGGAVRGRYSIIGLDPDVIFRVNGVQAEINRTVETDPAAFVPVTAKPASSIFALPSGDFTAFWMSALSFATISGGVFAGATMPNHELKTSCE